MMIGKFDLVIATCFNLLLAPLKLQIVLLCITKARKHVIRVTSIVNFSNVQNNYLRTCYYDDFVFAPLAVTAKQHLGAQSHNCHLEWSRNNPFWSGGESPHLFHTCAYK